MRIRWLVLSVLVVVMAMGLMIQLGRGEAASEAAVASGGRGSMIAMRGHKAGSGGVPKAATLRIAILPESGIFQQRRRYAALCREIARRLDCPVELVTENTYGAVLADLESGRVDAAFVGSFIAVLAEDRCDVEPLCRPELTVGGGMHRGVLISREDGPIRTVDDLERGTIAVVRATTTADLFPAVELDRHGLLAAERRPTFAWVGTHDAAIRALAEGRVDAAAVKDSRLDAVASNDGAVRFRRLAESAPAPCSVLVIRRTIDDCAKTKLRMVLLDMAEDEDGVAVLERFGADRFVTSGPADDAAVWDMVRRLGDWWPVLGVSGAPPRGDAGRSLTGASE